MSQTTEDIFRQQVVTLLSRSNNDLPTLLKNISRSLNESGRSDVKLEVDTSGTVIKVSQSPYHVNAHVTTFQQSLDAMVADAKKKLAAIVPPKETMTRSMSALSSQSPRLASKSPLPTTTAGVTSPAGATAAASLAPSTTASPGPIKSSLTSESATVRKGKPSFRSQSASSPGRHATNSKATTDDLPTSNYNGNYILFRYGGKFPKHANYGFYRRYGLEGRGAATSDRHNFPLGAAPDRSTVHRL